MRASRIIIIELLFLRLADSCDSNDIKKEEIILTQANPVNKIVLRTDKKNIDGLTLKINGEVTGSGQLSIGENDATFYKTYDLNNGQIEIKYIGDWYSQFCYVTFRSTTKTSGQLKLEADFAGD
jgi:hypothetical protein